MGTRLRSDAFVPSVKPIMVKGSQNSAFSRVRIHTPPHRNGKVLPMTVANRCHIKVSRTRMASPLVMTTSVTARHERGTLDVRRLGPHPRISPENLSADPVITDVMEGYS